MTIKTFFVLTTFASTCGDTGGPPDDEYGNEYGSVCYSHKLMMDHELAFAVECTDDSDCTQILEGTGCGCDTDGVIANSGYNTEWYYDMADAADSDGCELEYSTTCDCVVDAEPVCDLGVCAWG